MALSTVNAVTIALRIIPIFLTENALLDDVNVAAELGLQEQLQRINVSVLNRLLKIFC